MTNEEASQPLTANSESRVATSQNLVICLTVASVVLGLFFTGRNIDLYAASGSAAFGTLIAAIFSRPGTRLPIGIAGTFLLAYAAWNAMSVYWSSASYISEIETGLTLAGIAIYMSWRLIHSTTRELPTFLILVVGGIIFGTTMLVQYKLGIRPHAMLLNPNSAAGFLNFLWPAAAVGFLLSTGTRTIRLGSLAAMCLMLFALAIDGSRGAILGAVTGLLIIVATSGFILQDKRSAVVLFSTGAGALLFAFLLGGSSFEAQLSSVSDPGLASSGRFTIWRAAWQMALEQPILGFGPGTFWLAYPAFRAFDDRSAGLFAHNDYLQFWIEGGIPNPLLVFCIGAAVLWLFVRVIRTYGIGECGRREVLRATASFSALVAVGSHSFFTFNLQMMAFILMLGIHIAEIESAAGSGSRLQLPLLRSPLRLLPVVSLLLLSLIPFGHFARASLAFGHVETGSSEMQEGNILAAARSFGAARFAWPQLDAGWYLHANLILESMRRRPDLDEERRRELVARANDLLDEAERHNPLRASTYLIRGMLRSDHPDIADASPIPAIERALYLDPRNIEARYALSQVLEREGQSGAAKRVLKEGLRIEYGPAINPAPLRERLRSLDMASGAESTLPRVDKETSLTPAPAK